MGPRLRELVALRDNAVAKSSGAFSNADWEYANRDELVRAQAVDEGDSDFLALLDRATADMEGRDAVSSHMNVDTVAYRPKPGIKKEGLKVVYPDSATGVVGYNDVAPGEVMYGDPRYYQEGTEGKETGKLRISPKELHGGRNSRESLLSIMGAQKAIKQGSSLVDRPAYVDNSSANKAIEDAIRSRYSYAGKQNLAKVGLRGGVAKLTPQDQEDRAVLRGGELYRGYNDKTGMPYGEAALDGGHKEAHHNAPELSTAKENMMFENKYENRAKQDALTPDDEYNKLEKGLRDRLRDGEISTDEYIKVMEIVNMKGDEGLRMAGASDGIKNYVGGSGNTTSFRENGSPGADIHIHKYGDHADTHIHRHSDATHSFS